MSAKPSSRWPLVLLLVLIVVAAVGGYAAWRWKQGRTHTPDHAAAVRANNRGVGLMEQFDFQAAVPEFEQAVADDPTWLPGRINLAIALVNVNTPASHARATELFKQVLAEDANNPYGHFGLGLLEENAGHFPEAASHFEKVTAIDGRDAGAWYHLGQALDAQGQAERAVECFEKARRLNPYQQAAVYALGIHLRQTDPDRGNQFIEESEQLRKAQIDDMVTSTKYTEQGSRYAEVIGRNSDRSTQPKIGPVPLFERSDKFAVKLAEGVRWATAADFGTGPVADLRRAIRARFGATMVLLDYNRDRKPDVFLLGAVVEKGQVRDLLLRNDGNGQFTDVTAETGLAGERPSLGCAVADFDNDGFPDLIITGAGTQKLFRNDGKGHFEDVTAKAGLDKLGGVCLGCGWADVDQDGDLDLLIARYADTPESALASLKGEAGKGSGVAVFLNVGQALPAAGKPDAPPLTVAFERAPKVEEALGAGPATVGFVLSDLDGDHDPDVLLLADRASPALVLNDRLLRFHRAKGAIAPPDVWNGALVLDATHDERSSVFLIRQGQAPLLLLNQANPSEEDAGKWFKAGATNSPPLLQASVSDVDLDGWADVVGLSAERRPVLLQNDGTGRLVHQPQGLGADADWPKDLISLAIADLDDDCHPDLLLWSEGTGLELRRGRANGNHALKLELSGRRKRETTVRTNADAIGSRVAAQVGTFWTGMENATLSAGLGQSRLPLELGLGSNEKADVVRLRWADGVPQAELDVATCTVVVLEETYRKGESCPVLLTWDGKRFRFVTDFLGAGSMGELSADGSTRPPRPEESVKIEPGQLVPRDGQFVLKIAEPMNEIMYLDRLQLVVLDHPANVCVFPDERFATQGPPPSQELLAFRTRFFPVKATDHKGRDVTAVLQHRDRKMVDGFARRSWLGYAEEHWIELDFGDQLKQMGPRDRLFLCLAGWTDYPYPESIYAATQAGVALQPPVLERLGSDRKWQSVGELGFPAGLPRMMTKEVTGLVSPATGCLRIRTNAQVYWDQIFLAPLMESVTGKPGGAVHAATLEVAGATLAERGFLEETSPDGKPPVEYDDEKIEPVVASRWQGMRTRTGDVTELLRERDDRFVICGPGDEITVRFDARLLPPLPEGWQRSFVLRTWGYCKDASLFTATGGNVEPLPFAGMKKYPYGPEQRYPDDAAHQEYRQRYNVRPASAGR
jgi:Tfp pilus assembly protein PilF